MLHISKPFSCKIQEKFSSREREILVICCTYFTARINFKFETDKREAMERKVQEIKKK